MQKGTRAVPCKQNTTVRFHILTRFMCSEKESTVLMDSKDRQVRHCLLTKEKCCDCYPALDLAKKTFWWLKEISIFLLSTWNLHFRETIFVKVALRDFWQRRWKTCMRFRTSTQNISALNYAQDFGTTVKESVKWTRKNSKCRIVPCQILSCLSQQC